MRSHQYVERSSAQLRDEWFCGDPVVSFLYSRAREDAGWLYRALTSAQLTHVLGAVLFDVRPLRPERMRQRYARELGVDFSECLASPETMDTPRKVFERQIRYWECRPITADPTAVVSPSDARLLIGSLAKTSRLFLKHKFFELDELLGTNVSYWRQRFENGDFAVFRLTPEKYHYNHVPATGVVRAYYELDGVFQSCHPGVVVAQAVPYSKNRRTVTILDTDISDGSKVGLVAMIEIVALMIGDIVQCYSRERYDHPEPMRLGMRLERGAPKSLFRPGSSTVVLLFEPGRIRFCADLIANQQRSDARSLYGPLGRSPPVETDVQARSTIAGRSEDATP